MDIFSIFIVIGLTVFLLLYCNKRGMSLLRYYKFSKENKLITVNGKIVERINEQYKQFGKKRCYISLPKVRYTFEGERKEIQGIVYHSDIVLNEELEIAVYKGSKEKMRCEAWIVRDVPRMTEEFLMRMIIQLVMIILVIISAIIA